MKENEKIKWHLVLLLAIGLFIMNLSLQNFIINLLIIILAVIIYRYGNPILFKEYNARQKQKMNDSGEIRKAANQVLTSGKLFKR